MNAISTPERIRPQTEEDARLVIDQVNETHTVVDVLGSAIHDEIAVILDPAPWPLGGSLPLRGRVIVYIPCPGLTLGDLQAYRASWGLSPEVSRFSSRWHVGPFPALMRGLARRIIDRVRGEHAAHEAARRRLEQSELLGRITRNLILEGCCAANDHTTHYNHDVLFG